MESFSEKIKREVAEIKTTNPDSALSFLSAIVKTAGEIQKNNAGESIVVFTELIEVFNKINELTKLLYNDVAELEIADEQAFSSKRYEIKFSQNLSERILQDAEIIEYNEEHFPIFNGGISKYIIDEPEKAKSYVMGAILGCFTCSISFMEETQKIANGYHAEFVFSNEAVALDFSLLLAQFEIISKKVARKNSFVVYIKEFESICNLLALVGASKSVLKLQNENTIREVRNNINRQNNCYTSNVSKSVNASLSQLENIKTIMSTIGLDSLEQSLQDVANLRLANPEENLEELTKLSQQKITKSGLYHRFKKIEKIANELKR